VNRLSAVVTALVVLLATLIGAALAGVAAAPPVYKNCTNLNKKYPHGLGKKGARDRTSGTPVTNFKRSTKLYNLAMSYNRGLDRDKDGVACEQGGSTSSGPKPWQWTPEKVGARLMAASPIVGDEVGSDVLSASCSGVGQGVAGRFSTSPVRRGGVAQTAATPRC
jgi:Excalibur calcium-binding domain